MATEHDQSISSGMGTSRIEAPKGLRKGFQDLPAWYHRLLHKVIDHDMRYAGNYCHGDPVEDSDFYEDLSDPDLGGSGKEDDEGEDEGTHDSASESQARQDCSRNGEGFECDSLQGEEGEEDDEDDWDCDLESERSYDGSDADLYYELKERREEVKVSREGQRARKETRHESELEKENEVRAVYRSFKKERKKGVQFPLDVHKTSRSYKLYSCDYVEHLWSEYFEWHTMRLDITVFDEQFLKTLSGNDNADLLGQVHGLIYLDGATCCDFGPFEPPRFARRKAFTYKAENQYNVSIRFVGERHIKVMLPREFVTCDGSRPISDSAPAIFTFYGTMMDLKNPGGQGSGSIVE